MSSILARATLKVAATQLNVREQGTNAGPEVRAYLASVGLGVGHSWCMAFVCWCFKQAADQLGIENTVPVSAGVLDHWQRGQEVPRALILKPALFMANPALLQPGMVFYHHNTPKGWQGHTGLIERVEGNWVHTLEGNTNAAGSREGDGVYRKVRHVNYINVGAILFA